MALERLQITRRGPYASGRAFGPHGAYEQIDGVAHFGVDPRHPANRDIVDLDRAPRDTDGRVRFTADFSVVMPVDPEAGNRVALVELPNRGRRRIVHILNRAPTDAGVTREAHPGDGFLFRHGYTVVSIGWQWDVYRSETLMGLDAPLAMEGNQPLGGQSIVEFRPNERSSTRLLADRVHQPLPAAPGEQPDAELRVREFEDGGDTIIERSRWQFGRETADGTVEPSCEHVYLDGGFEPGRIYHLVYRTDRAPVAGAGLIALRDVAPFLRSAGPENPTSGSFDAVVAWGVSQTGRMLRHFMSLGLNVTEDDERAYDGIAPHIAGARRGAFNHRFAQPSNQTTPLWGHVFPFADRPSDDPLTGGRAGLLDRMQAQNAVPRIVSTNSAAEYWRGDATLAHVDTTGTEDIAEHPDTRSYLFASVQHVPGYPGQPRFSEGIGTTSRHTLNVLDYRPLLRAALVNLHGWITQDIAPPPSRHPRLADGSAVDRGVVLAALAAVPGLHLPDPQRLPFVRTVDMGADETVGVGVYPAIEGAFYPALVSAVDADGNETAGVRLPDVSVPVATHTGWNPRDPSTGAPEQIVPMNGLTHWLARTAAERQSANDPRPSLEERYAGRDDYAARVRDAAEALSRERYLLAEDVEIAVAAALERYDWALRDDRDG